MRSRRGLWESVTSSARITLVIVPSPKAMKHENYGSFGMRVVLGRLTHELDIASAPAVLGAISVGFLDQASFNLDAYGARGAEPRGTEYGAPQPAAQIDEHVIRPKADVTQDPKEDAVRHRRVVDPKVGVILHSNGGVIPERRDAQPQIPEMVVRMHSSILEPQSLQRRHHLGPSTKKLQVPAASRSVPGKCSGVFPLGPGAAACVQKTFTVPTEH